MVFKFIKEGNVFSFKRGGQPRRLYITLDLPSFGSCSPMPSACRVQYSGTVAPLSGLDHRRSATRPNTLSPLTHDEITRLSPDELLALIAQLWIRFLSKAKPRTQRTDPIARTPLRIYFSCTGDWMKPKVTRDKLEQLWRDPVNWKRGLIYSCKDDPRIVVPKKQKWRGWTINFAHRRATPTLILMVLAAGLPVFLLAIFGLARTPICWACLFLTMAIICLVCWYLSSPNRYV
jgi:hypothetical protein